MTVESATGGNGTEQLEPNASQPRFAIELSGVRIPKMDLEASNIEVQNPPEVVRIQREFTQLQAELKTIVNATVREADAIENALTLRQAIESYSNISERLLAVYSEWTGLLERVTKIEGIEVGEFSTGETKRQVQVELQKWQIEIQANIQMDDVGTGSSVTAKHASRPLPEFKATIEKDIAKRIDTLCSGMLQQLISLVDLEIIAFIEWFDDHACTYQKFTRKFEVEQLGNPTEELNMDRVNKRWRKITTTRTAGTTRRKLCRHIQHLVRAKVHRLGESEVLIPREQKALIDSMPMWLAPSVRIVEGTLIRETLVEQDLEVHTWETKTDEFQWHNDPAIVLGPFVLSAWGPTEIKKEIDAQEKEEVEKRKTLKPSGDDQERRMSYFKIAGMVVLSISEISLIQIRTMSNVFVFGIFLAAVSVVLLALPWGVSKQREADESRTRANRFAACYAIGMVLCMAFAAISLAVDQFGITVCCLAIGGYLLIQYIQASFAWDRLPEESQTT